VSDLLLGGLLPRRWHWDPAKIPWIDIILDWQDFELDDKIEDRLLIIRQIHGHRRHEVMDWFEETREHRDMWLAKSIYGLPGACP
jgi:hypothetical protein